MNLSLFEGERRQRKNHLGWRGLYHSITGTSDRNQLFLMGHPKLSTPSPFEDGDRSILQNVVGLLAPSNEQCSKNQA